MPFKRPEIKTFMIACEQIQRLMAQGTSLSQDEQELIEFCVKELLKEMRGSRAAA